MDHYVIEGDISERHPCMWCVVDGKVKVNFTTLPQPQDSIVLDISITNNAKIRGPIRLARNLRAYHTFRQLLPVATKTSIKGEISHEIAIGLLNYSSNI